MHLGSSEAMIEMYVCVSEGVSQTKILTVRKGGWDVKQVKKVQYV